MGSAIQTATDEIVYSAAGYSEGIFWHSVHLTLGATVILSNGRRGVVTGFGNGRKLTSVQQSGTRRSWFMDSTNLQVVRNPNL